MMLALSYLLLAAAAQPSQVAREQRIEVPAPPVIRAGPPLPPPPMVRSLVVTQPDWLRTPTSEETRRHFPVGALQLGKAGRAVLRCRVEVDGRLGACVVVLETPAGLQFGKAALEMAPLFKMRPESRDGEPVAGKSVTFPVVFLIN